MNLQDESARIVQEYTTHPDQESEAHCAWIKAGIEIAIDTIGAALSFCGGNAFFTPAKEAAKKACEKFAPFAITVATKDIVHIGDTLDETTRVLKSKLQDAPSTDDDLHMQQTYLSGVCSLAGGGMKDEDFKRYSQMSTNIGKTFRKLRGNFEQLIQNITEYRDPTTEYSPLAMVLGSLDYNNVAKKITGGTAKFEE